MSDGALQARLAAEWDAALDAGIPVAAAEIVAAIDQPSRVDVIAELDELRLLFSELRESLDDAGAATLATSRWTVRDVLAHIASWARQTRVEVERLAASEPFDETIHFGPGGPHAWNQREVDARRSATLDDLFNELEAETSRLIDLVVSAPEEAVRGVVELPRTMGEPPVPWRMPLGFLLIKTCWHTRYHLARLRSR